MKYERTQSGINQESYWESFKLHILVVLINKTITFFHAKIFRSKSRSSIDCNKWYV